MGCQQLAGLLGGRAAAGHHGAAAGQQLRVGVGGDGQRLGERLHRQHQVGRQQDDLRMGQGQRVAAALSIHVGSRCCRC